LDARPAARTQGPTPRRAGPGRAGNGGPAAGAFWTGPVAPGTM